MTNSAICAIDVCFSQSMITGKERDTESGNDYFGARYYASSMGRFMSPDSSGFSHLSNPQAWNLYAYTYNNPTSLRDPDGHDVSCANNTAQCVADANKATNGGGRVTSTTTTTDHSFLGLFHWTTTETKLAISGDINRRVAPVSCCRSYQVEGAPGP